MTNSGISLPLAVIIGASLSTVVVWLSSNFKSPSNNQ